MSSILGGITARVRAIGVFALVASIAGVALFAHAQTGASVIGQAIGQTTTTPTPTPTPTAFILGQVVDAAGGGVANAIVTLSGGLVQQGGFAYNVAPTSIPGGPRRTFTNGTGYFLFSNLTKGAYSIDATRPGYESGSYGKHRPDGLAQSLDLGEGERSGNVKITIWKHAAITGRLTDDLGEPYVGATVQALRRTFVTGRSQFTVTTSAPTDDRGVYRIAGLTPGEYLVCVAASQTSIPMSVVDAYSQARLNGTAADFTRQLQSSAAYTLPLGSAGMRVGEWTVSYSGTYLRGVTPPGPDESGRPLLFQTTFFPAALTVSNAEVISLASGDERAGVDIQLHLVPVAPVIGAVTGSNGPVPFIGIRLVPEFASEMGEESSFDAGTTMTDANGRFGFPAVPLGRYVLRALKVPVPPPPPPVRLNPGETFPPPQPPQPIPQEPTLWANAPITVGPEGLPDVNLHVNTGFRISGKFVFDGQSPKPPGTVVQTMYMLVQPAEGHQIGYISALRGQTKPDGTFTSYEIPPGKYFIRMAAPTPSWQAMPGWLYVSSVAKGRDVGGVALDLQGDITDLVITMSDHPTEVTGVVRDENGRPDPKAMVLVYSANSVDWSNFGDTPRRIRSVRPSPTGAYRVPALPPGPYFVAAVPDAQAADWQDPRVLQTISRSAVQVTLGDGEKRTQDLVTRMIR